MSSHVTVDRWQFTLTVMVHYVFPIITMGLALFIAWLETVSLLGSEHRRLRLLRKTAEQRAAHHNAAHFWAKIFAVNFGFGVVTGIPLEFQFGTNWAGFSNFSGGVIGQTLAMEGVFAFFAESIFIGLFLWGRERIGPRLHWLSAVMVWVGSWISGFFIIVTNAWMQHPVAYTLKGGSAQLDSFWGLLTNPWVGWQYAHNMSGAAISGAFLLAAGGAFYLLLGRHIEFARTCLTVGVVGALIFSAAQIYPTGDGQAHQLSRYQPSGFAAAEGLFHTEKGAPLVDHRQPGHADGERSNRRSRCRTSCRFLTSRRWNATLRGPRLRSRRPLAELGAARLLRLPHHGRPRHDPAPGRAASASCMLRRGRLFSSRPDAVGAAAGVPVHVRSPTSRAGPSRRPGGSRGSSTACSARARARRPKSRCRPEPRSSRCSALRGCTSSSGCCTCSCRRGSLRADPRTSATKRGDLARRAGA